MIPIATPVLTTTTSPRPAPAGDREKLAAAAKQFEAIFIRQMLAEARKADFGDKLFGGQGMDTFRQMEDDRFADIAAKTGAFGLASMLDAQLSKFLPKKG